MSNTLITKLKQYNSSVTDDDFFNGNIWLVHDNDGIPNGKVGDTSSKIFISTWNHPTVTQPTQAQLDAIGEQMSILKVDTLQNSVGENLIFENKNLLINGGMNIFQRSISVTGITAGSYHTVDRWKTQLYSLGTWTQERSTDVPSAQGFGYSLKMDCTTADASPSSGDFCKISQFIEGQNLQHLLKGTSSSKAVTLSFWVKSNKTGTYVCEIRDVDNTRMVSKGYTIDTANTWEKKTILIPGDTTGTLDNDSGSSFDITFWLAAGSLFTGGTLQSAWGGSTNGNRAAGQVNLADSTDNEWYITGCQLELGSKATDFEFEPFPTILRKCRRYYVRWDRTGPPAVPYVQAVYVGHGSMFSTTEAVVYPIMYEPMRDTPDVGVSATDDFSIVLTGNATKTTSALAVYNDASHTDETLSYNPMIQITISSTTSNGKYGRFFINDATNGFLELDAELE